MCILTSKDVFICHASEDKETIVNPIKDACREVGVSTWVDDDEIQWGESITKRVQEGARQFTNGPCSDKRIIHCKELARY